jgi:predicted PurR-regulated permease PerM
MTADSVSSEIMSAAQKAFSFGAAYKATSDFVLMLAAFFLTWVLIAYVMIGAPKLAEGALWLVPPERRPPIRRLAPKVIPVIQRYFIGLAGVVAITFVLAWVGFGFVLHLPHALILSIAIALLETIPGLGPFLSGVLAGLASLSAHSLLAIGFTIFYVIALRLFVDNVVGPILLGRQTELPPLAVIFSLVVGGLLFGVPGFLLAVPICATARIVLAAVYEDRETPA